jgi:hypothetical protein
MAQLQLLAWLETQKTPNKASLKRPNTTTYSEKRTSGFSFFAGNPHQEKSNFNSLKYLRIYDVKRLFTA